MFVFPAGKLDGWSFFFHYHATFSVIMHMTVSLTADFDLPFINILKTKGHI